MQKLAKEDYGREGCACQAPQVDAADVKHSTALYLVLCPVRFLAPSAAVRRHVACLASVHLASHSTARKADVRVLRSIWIVSTDGLDTHQQDNNPS